MLVEVNFPCIFKEIFFNFSFFWGGGGTFIHVTKILYDFFLSFSDS